MKNADTLKNVKPGIEDVLIKYLSLLDICPDQRGQTWAYILVTENIFFFFFGDPGNSKKLEDWSMKYILTVNVLIMYREGARGIEMPVPSDFVFCRLTSSVLGGGNFNSINIDTKVKAKS